MSLVVAGIEDGRISMVADTKITYEDDDARTRQLFLEALPKILLLRSDVAVGYAGIDPPKLIESIVAVRNEKVEDVLERLATIDGGEFVVASRIDEPRLFRVAGGVDERTHLRRSWAGDPDAYDRFRASFNQWGDQMPVDFRLMASMQDLLTRGGSATVGGMLTRLADGPEGFTFVSDPSVVMPDWFAVIPLVGIAPTIGALAYYLTTAGAGPIFPESDPAQRVWARAASVEEFVALAREDHGQHLTFTSLEAAFGSAT